ncbi:plasmid maintenance protein [Candidatus Borreliella tachyglossi]|uniref:plasmid maintenance protein n=1 Tax=Candidatus Borreliella tachyglossi TaxID=1964448 RepID=UPI004042EFA6
MGSINTTKDIDQQNLYQCTKISTHTRLFKELSIISYYRQNNLYYNQTIILNKLNEFLIKDNLKTISIRTLRRDLDFLIDNKIIKRKLERKGERQGSQVRYATCKYSVVNLKTLLKSRANFTQRDTALEYELTKEAQQHYYQNRINTKKFSKKMATDMACQNITNNNKITKEETQKKTKSKKPTKLQIKQSKLAKILSFSFNNLEKEGYNKQQLDIEKEKIYETYKLKPHFIIEHTKYNDLKLKVNRIKKILPSEVKQDTTQQQKQLKNNIISILISQFENKIDRNELRPYLNKYLNTQGELTFSKIYDNRYYIELRTLLETDNKITTLNGKIPSYLRKYEDNSIKVY